MLSLRICWRSFKLTPRILVQDLRLSTMVWYPVLIDMIIQFRMQPLELKLSFFSWKMPWKNLPYFLKNILLSCNFCFDDVKGGEILCDVLMWCDVYVDWFGWCILDDINEMTTSVKRICVLDNGLLIWMFLVSEHKYSLK